MTEQLQEPQQLDRKDLKILALKDRVSEEAERNADLRAELTLTISAANEQIQKLNVELSELKEQLPEPVEPVQEDENEVPVEDSSTSSK